jgi:hypothetical protein
VLLGAASTPLVVPFACSDTSGTPGQEDAGNPEASRTDRNADVDADQGPIYNAEGWVRLDFPECDFFAAPTPEKMPPPIEWEPCATEFAAQGWSCRRVKTNWAPPSVSGRQMMGSAENAWVDEKGHAWIVVRVNSGAIGYLVVAEVDGPVHAAVSRPLTPNCHLSDQGLSGRKVLFHAWRTQPTSAGGSETVRAEALGGSVDTLPAVLESHTDGLDRGYYAGPNAYVALADLSLRSWTPGGPATPLTVVDPGQARDFTFAGDVTFFTVGNLAYHRVKVFTTVDGLRDFISFGNDPNAAAADFGTDGVNMVWSEASGKRETESDPWTTIDVMKAPYTSDPT